MNCSDSLIAEIPQAVGILVIEKSIDQVVELEYYVSWDTKLQLQYARYL